MCVQRKVVLLRGFGSLGGVRARVTSVLVTSHSIGIYTKDNGAREGNLVILIHRFEHAHNTTP